MQSANPQRSQYDQKNILYGRERHLIFQQYNILSGFPSQCRILLRIQQAIDGRFKYQQKVLVLSIQRIDVEAQSEIGPRVVPPEVTRLSSLVPHLGFPAIASTRLPIVSHALRQRDDPKEKALLPQPATITSCVPLPPQNSDTVTHNTNDARSIQYTQGRPILFLTPHVELFNFDLPGRV